MPVNFKLSTIQREREIHTFSKSSFAPFCSFAKYYTIYTLYFIKPVSLNDLMFKLICYEICYDSQCVIEYILTIVEC